jgi:hypothetical protein
MISINLAGFDLNTTCHKFAACLAYPLPGERTFSGKKPDIR